jgi:pyrroline-5-carboxylate reductase
MKGTDSLRVVEVDAERSAKYSTDGFRLSTRLERLEDDDIVVLAVPPQQFEQALVQNELLKTSRPGHLGHGRHHLAYADP